MRWKGRRISSNVEDRRGGGGVRAGGISIIGLVVAFVAWKFFGVDPQQAYQATQQVTASQQSNATAPESLTAEQKKPRILLERFWLIQRTSGLLYLNS